MGRILRFAASALVGLAFASSAGCSAQQSLSSPTGTGGAAGRRVSGSGGMAGAGAGFRDGGRMDAFVSASDGGTAQGGGGTETMCVGDAGWNAALDGGGSAADAGVCAVLPADLPAFPWVQPHVGAVDASASNCQTTSVSGQIVDMVCRGQAWLRASGAAATSGEAVPTLTWDDGSSVSWDATGLDPSIPAPIAPGAADQRVWAELETHGWLAVPGQCGWSWDQTMDLRDAQGGPIRFMARQGASVPEPTADELLALFGASVQPRLSCTHDALGGPALFHQTLLDQVLETNPPQVIPYGRPTVITTPNGRFGVLWYSRTQVARPLSNTCAGCLNQGPIVGLIASRIAAPDGGTN